jgi:membrane protease YdiL (CAAX protease family)
VSLARVLRTPAGAWRAPWRLATFALAATVGLLLAQSLFYPVASAIGSALGLRLSLFETLLCIALAIAHVAALRWLDDRPWREVGMGEGSWRPRALITGTLSGLLGIGVPILLLVGVGWLALGAAPEGSSLALGARLLLFLAPAALWEELAFRGYPLTVLADTFGARAAVAVTSLVFGLIHLTNPGADWRSTTLVTLAGVWLGVVRLGTGSLWAAWLAHLAWNWTMAGLWHAPVSGVGMGVVDWRLLDAGPDWATGGTWGPEGGLFAALGMIGGTLWFGAGPRASRDAAVPDDITHTTRP